MVEILELVCFVAPYACSLSYLGLNGTSCRSFETSSKDSAEHVYTDSFTLDLALGLVLGVGWYFNLLAVDLPPTGCLRKFDQCFSTQIQPAAQDAQINLSERLSNFTSDPYPDKVFETSNICIQVGIQVVRL